MKDMQAHLERLRDQAAECAVLSGEAKTKERREYFATLYRRLTYLAHRAEAAINETATPDTFRGRQTQEPSPGGEE